MRLLLNLLGGLIVFKRHSGYFFALFTKPLRAFSLFFIRWFFLPWYRWLRLIRRLLSRLFQPAKHRLFYLFTNRFSIHIVMALIALGVMVMNIQALEVRAESFGQKSLLYQFVSTDDSLIVDVISADHQLMGFGKTTAYFQDTPIDARAHIDLNYLEQSYVTTETGSPTAKSTPQTPARSSVETYVVQEGDTLGEISEKFGLSLSTLLWSNNLSFRSTIHPSDSLTILPVDGVLYTVRNGDTLSRIARLYQVEPEKIMQQNNLESAHKLSIGQQLLLPGGEPPSATASARGNASVGGLFTAPSRSSTDGVASGWIWPTDWHVITQVYGWRHTGIDMDGDYSTVSYASRDGVVIYSGWRGGYGLCVEIDHGDGFVTRYGHHSKNYVSVGDVVSAGQVIAQTGTTGRSTGTHLHFEIIKNGRFQNPLNYLR